LKSGIEASTSLTYWLEKQNFRILQTMCCRIFLLNVARSKSTKQQGVEMKVAVTGATGFVGRALAVQLVESGDTLKCWHRENSDLTPLASLSEHIQWIPGELADEASAKELVAGCDAVVHSGLWRSGMSFQVNEADVVEYARVNILGTLQLIEAAIVANVTRFVFVSTCAVHDHILDNRPLDETHPLWANSHYGAHKAAIEKFVHSYGLGNAFPICAIRPTGIYGVARPVKRSKWFDLVRKVANGDPVEVSRGGKEVHVEDVAKAIRVLLNAEGIAGQAYSCYDRYISEFDVATIAKRICGSQSEIIGDQKRPKHEIDASKIKALGMEFGGEIRLQQTVKELLGVLGEVAGNER
jgi:nucleoside-diphosphate-sugar epimerase